MSTRNLEAFWQEYERQLRVSVTAAPADYALGPKESPGEYAAMVAHKFEAACARPTGYSVKNIMAQTPTFKRTCRAFGIKCSVYGINTFINDGEVVT